MGKPDRERKPGIDLWEVMQAEETKSRAGDAMFKMKYKRVSDPSAHIYDNVMLAGGGWGIGKQKLAALGVANDFKGEIDPLDFVGKRVWISTGVSTWEGKDNLKPITEGLKMAGYQPEEMVPEGHTLPEPPKADEVPF